ncbi:hypothetical protein C7G43_07235 [Bradyrhizobium sp. MOS004]|nr:hypothetical protein C7G43_07235 [Bradyrhizobium sp. MOS004]HAR23162.1 hypothetical protein [Bradyrhizobium sp.]
MSVSSIDDFLTYEVELIIRQGLRWCRISAEGAGLDRPALSPSRVVWIASCIADAGDATRSAGVAASRRPIDAGLIGSCRRLLQLGLRLWLRRLSRCRRLLKLRQLSYAIRGERIVVNGNERVVIEVRLMVHRHQRVIGH